MSPERFGIRTEVLEILGIRCVESDVGELLFPLANYAGSELAKREIVLPDRKVVTRQDFFFEHAFDHERPGHIFLFSRMTDLLAFYQLNQARLRQDTILTAIGYNPDSTWMMSYLTELALRYRSLKTYLAFGNDLPGRINDIRLACWARGRDVQVCAAKGLIYFKAGRYEAGLSAEKLSLSAFCKASGFRTHLRTLKPTTGKCFWEQLCYTG